MVTTLFRKEALIQIREHGEKTSVVESRIVWLKRPKLRNTYRKASRHR
jgi:hypothetical protein